MKKILAVGILLSLFSIGYVFGSNISIQKKPAVLFVGYGANNYIIARDLYKDGFTLNNFTQSLLTWDEVRNYNVIVLTGTGLGPSNSDFTLTQINKQNISVLKKFLSAGGGILYIPYWGEMNSAIPPQDAFGKDIGIKPLFRDVIFDSETQKIATAWVLPFAWTNNITASPITEDIKNLWYPCATRAGGILHTITFVPDSHWHVVVKGLPSSHTEKFSLLLYSFTSGGKKGSYSTEVPLVAYRQFKKGRIVCLSISSDYLFGTYANTTLEGIVLNKGLDGKPSNGYQILENSLQWLSEPSMKKNILGGAGMDFFF
ncbi:MAG: hypothetical protein M1409_09965, partial [Actinobacteria bacterium]|nr:hypothetical protein [Actinomycetota bacterium]